MTVERYFESLPSVEWRRSRRSEVFVLTSLLVGGLLFVAPVLSTVTGTPLLIWVATVAGAFGVVVAALRAFVLGSYVALVVTMTFAANVPLAPAEYLKSMPGMIGPNVWLVHFPMAALIAIFLWRSRSALPVLAPSEYLFGGFVAWTVVSAAFGATPRPDTAFYFSLLMLQGWIVFVIVRRGVRNDDIGFESVVSAVTITVIGHAAFGAAQFLNQGTFGYTRLGEVSPSMVASTGNQVSFGPLGVADLDVFVAGFTGMAFILASLLVLVLPVTIAMAVRHRGWRRGVAVSSFVLGSVVLRFTTTDAGRGGFLLAVCSFAVGIVVFRRDLVGAPHLVPSGSISRPPADRYRDALRRTPAVLTCALAAAFCVLFPSSRSGAKSTGSTAEASGGNGMATAQSNGSDTSAGSLGTGGSSSAPNIEEMSIPFLDLSNLGTRVQQYAIGLDVFGRHPFLGIGGGNFWYVEAAYGVQRPLPLHNIYLALLVETGIPGFVLYVTSIAVVFRSGWRSFRRADPGNLLVLGLLSGMIGYLGFAFWDHLALDRLTSFLPFWALAGAIVGGDHERTERGRPRRSKRGP